MRKLAAVVVLVGLAVVVGALALGQASSSSPKKIFESAIVGVPEGMTGAAGAIRGVNGAGAPWVVSEGQTRLDADGRLRVEVEGLVLAGSFTNPVANIRASLTCEGTNVVATTGAVPLSVPDGDAKIDEMISLPASCVGPIVLVRISGAAGPGSWLAATGSINAPAFKADPFAFDPDDTKIVVGDWVHHLGLNDAKGEARDGLLLSKGGAGGRCDGLARVRQCRCRRDDDCLRRGHGCGPRLLGYGGPRQHLRQSEVHHARTGRAGRLRRRALRDRCDRHPHRGDGRPWSDRRRRPVGRRSGRGPFEGERQAPREGRGPLDHRHGRTR